MKKNIDTTEAYGIPEENLNLSIFRLAHFQPTLNVIKDNQIIDYLVLDALASCGSLFKASIHDIQSIIRKNILLEFEPQEILESVKRLKRNNSINTTEVDQNIDQIRISITEISDHELSIKRESLKKIEEETINTWKTEIYERYNNDRAIIQNIEKIESTLKLFLSKIFLKHGVESVSILYPESEQTDKWLKSIQDLGESLPHYNDYLDSIIKIEIPRFIKGADSTRKKYLTNLFNASFYWHLIHVDSKGSKLLSSITQGQKLIIDNNILYNLVGIGGEENLKSSHKLLMFAVELDMRSKLLIKQ